MILKVRQSLKIPVLCWQDGGFLVKSEEPFFLKGRAAEC